MERACIISPLILSRYVGSKNDNFVFRNLASHVSHGLGQNLLKFTSGILGSSSVYFVASIQFICISRAKRL